MTSWNLSIYLHLQNFGRHLYPEQLTFWLIFYKAEQVKVKILAQGPNSNSLVEVGFELSTF